MKICLHFLAFPDNVLVHVVETLSVIKDHFILHNHGRYRGCRWPGHGRNHNINSHDIDLVLLQYSGFRTTGVSVKGQCFNFPVDSNPVSWHDTYWDCLHVVTQSGIIIVEAYMYIYIYMQIAFQRTANRWVLVWWLDNSKLKEISPPSRESVWIYKCLAILTCEINSLGGQWVRDFTVHCLGFANLLYMTNHMTHK